MDKFISNRQSRLNRLEVLNKIYGYTTKENYNAETIDFKPKGYNTFSTALVTGTNVWNVPVWSEDLSSMRNKIYVDGAFEEDTRIESFSGNASTATFTLTYTPETVECKVGGTLQKLGIPGGSATGYDFSVDRELDDWREVLI